MMRNWIILGLALSALGGCKWLQSPLKENVEPPTELTEFAPSVEVRPLWSHKVGGNGEGAGLRLRPAFADGRIYASGADEGTVTAIDAASGATIWTAEIGAAVASGAGVGDGIVAVGTIDGEVIALDAADGSERWRASGSSEVSALVSRGNSPSCSRAKISSATRMVVRFFWQTIFCCC